jgi:hypothetical protein
LSGRVRAARYGRDSGAHDGRGRGYRPETTRSASIHPLDLTPAWTPRARPG